MGWLLVAVDGGRVLRCRVEDGAVRVPWAPGVRARPAAGGVTLEGGAPGIAGRDDRLPEGATARLGGALTACLGVERHPDGTEAARLGPGLVGASDAMIRALHAAACAASVDDPVTLLGESGTGKDALASAIHALGRGPARPYVAINVAALPWDLVEAELFGWVRGAFTGAAEPRPGAFEAAGDGTLFLDELAEAPAEVQSKLLRVAESGLVSRLGANRPQPVRARLIAATNRDPAAAVASGRLRLDLLERLACLVIRIPPLRARPEDLAPLAWRLCRQLPEPVSPDPGALEALADYAWPGNVRELRNVVRRAVLFRRDGRLSAGTVREAIAAGDLRCGPADPGGVREVQAPWAGGSWGLPRPRRDAEIAASGLPRSTFYYRLKRGLPVHGTRR